VQPLHRTSFLRSPRFWVIVVLVIGGLVLLRQGIDVETVRTRARELPGWLAFLLLVALPLVGFPASLLHVGVGVRFGIPLGLGLVWLSILLQLLASYGLVHWRRAFFSRRFRSIRKRIPPGAHAPVTLFTMLIPGAPFFAQNYTLPLLGVPLRLYLLICLPIHGARSVIAVVFGGQSHELTPGWVLAMLGYVAVVLGASWWALRRLKTTLGDQPRAESGRKQPA
jgi:uncharacterized membrane protein YdjX (TVP38/TMEM64 family)